mmetsp:Transcript_16071/g.32378  ORF Transcript_16071/g.32378 Transcript_16071/m.32378 type:complete len:205 (+) Transcript_16071:1310-1924(+)
MTDHSLSQVLSRLKNSMNEHKTMSASDQIIQPGTMTTLNWGRFAILSKSLLVSEEENRSVQMQPSMDPYIGPPCVSSSCFGGSPLTLAGESSAITGSASANLTLLLGVVPETGLRTTSFSTSRSRFLSNVAPICCGPCSSPPSFSGTESGLKVDSGEMAGTESTSILHVSSEGALTLLARVTSPETPAASLSSPSSSSSSSPSS